MHACIVQVRVRVEFGIGNCLVLDLEVREPTAQKGLDKHSPHTITRRTETASTSRWHLRVSVPGPSLGETQRKREESYKPYWTSIVLISVTGSVSAERHN